MTFLERELEDIIYENSSFEENRQYLQSRNFPIMDHGVMLRQVDLSEYGIADLIDVFIGWKRKGYERFIKIDIYELKKEEVNWDTFHQAVKYMRGVKLFLREYFPNHRLFLHTYLIGKTIDVKSNFCFTPSVFDNISVYTYKYAIDGLSFKEEEGYVVNSNKFKPEKIITNQFKRDLIEAYKQSMVIPAYETEEGDDNDSN